MDRVVLPGIPEESGGAGKQGMVSPYGQGPFCLCRCIQKMHRRDEYPKKGGMEYTDGPKHNKGNKDSLVKRTPQSFKDIHPFDKRLAVCN